MNLKNEDIKKIFNLIDSYQDKYYKVLEQDIKKHQVERYLDLDELEEIINRLKIISNIDNFNDLKSDLEFIEIYYSLKRFNRVNDWLSYSKRTLNELYNMILKD